MMFDVGPIAHNENVAECRLPFTNVISTLLLS